MARCYAGTVMLEGTTLSEGRGTTRPLELIGAPDLDVQALLRAMIGLAPAWLFARRLGAVFGGEIIPYIALTEKNYGPPYLTEYAGL